MEILIPGILLVAFMAWASTRIKRSAAEAYEAEIVEDDLFVIRKPDGFLHNLNADASLIFDAYSKEFSEDLPKLRAGRATIKAIPHSTIGAIATELKNLGASDQGNEVIDERHYRSFERVTEEEETPMYFSYKLGETDGTVYKLEVQTIGDQNAEKVETFIDSFRVK